MNMQSQRHSISSRRWLGCVRLTASCFLVQLAASAPQATVATVSAGQDEYLGWALADLGDQDGDGVPEVGVGSPRWEFIAGGGKVGRVQVISGASLLGGAPAVIRDIPGPIVVAGCAGTSGSNFGGAIAGGRDINGDGTPDFVASASFAGAVIPYDGATGAPILPAGFDLSGPCARRHGAQVQLLDADGDSYADVLVTSAAPSTNFASRYVVYRGAWIRDPVNGGAKELYNRGSSILLDLLGSAATLLGDLDGDQRDDYALTAPNTTPGQFAGGSVAVVSGATGVILHRFTRLGGGGSFANQIARVADLDGDGLDELAVSHLSWPSNAVSSGRVEVVSGAWMASGGVGQRSLRLIELPGAGTQTRFGRGLASADVNRDGVADIVACYNGTQVAEWAAISGRTGEVMWRKQTSQPSTPVLPVTGAAFELGSLDVALLGMPGTPAGPFSVSGHMTVVRGHDGAGEGSAFGVGCPCGGDVPDAGCANLTGGGAILAVETGSVSLSAASLGLTATGLPPFSFGLLIGGAPSAPAAVNNGLIGVSQAIRLGVVQSTGAGRASFSGDLLGDFSAGATPGTMGPMIGVPFATQLWYRDAGCAGASNFTNSYLIVPRP